MMDLHKDRASTDTYQQTINASVDGKTQTTTESEAKQNLFSNHSYGKHPPIHAERIFDTGAYYVWNYGIQVFASVCAGMWFKEGRGKPYFDKAANWLGENVMSKISSKTGAEAAKSSHSWLTMFALIMVGNFFIPPIQYVEKRKAYYVGKINDLLNARRIANGNPPTKEELQVQRDAIQAISEEPIQTSGSLWGGRALGLAANLAVSHFVVTQERDEKIQKAFAGGVSKVFDTLGLKSLANSKRVKLFSEIAILDYGYSIISSNVIYIYSHYINPPKEKPITSLINHELNDSFKNNNSLISDAKFLETPSPELLHSNQHVRLKPSNPQIAPSYEPQLAV